ncbi:MAG: cytochrome c [Acidobacteriota bacterium]|nr:cytochrome c [Acidobacteriota bacterium]
MKSRLKALPLLALGAAALVCLGCKSMPGYPRQESEVARPDEVLDFNTLYKQNCSGCHGENGRDGAALPLNNAAYLAIAGAGNLRTITAKGVNGTLMPPFARSAGGTLTDQQIDVVVQGMLHKWGKPAEFAGITLPPYASSSPGNAGEGQKTFVAACSRCHGVDGTGIKSAADGKPAQQGASPDSIVDPSYLALVSDQSLRSLVIAGRPDENVPDWRGYITGPGAHALTPQEIDNIVAWLAEHRAPAPAQSASGTGSTSGATGKEIQ